MVNLELQVQQNNQNVVLMHYARAKLVAFMWFFGDPSYCLIRRNQV